MSRSVGVLVALYGNIVMLKNPGDSLLRNCRHVLISCLHDGIEQVWIDIWAKKATSDALNDLAVGLVSGWDVLCRRQDT